MRFLFIPLLVAVLSRKHVGQRLCVGVHGELEPTSLQLRRKHAPVAARGGPMPAVPCHVTTHDTGHFADECNGSNRSSAHRS